MKPPLWLLFIFALTACQPRPPQVTLVILDGQKQINLETDASNLSTIFSQANIKLSDSDKVQYNGAELPIDFSLPVGGRYILQIQRAREITLVTPEGHTIFKTTAASVEQALLQTGLSAYAADFLEPAPETPINSDLTITYRPARDLSITVDGKNSSVKSSAMTVGQALTSTGIALLGLDISIPAENLPLPSDGKIRVVRVNETVSLIEKSIPFSKKIEYSTDLGVGTQKVIQSGQTGLIVNRVRIRYEDGAEVARTVEAETTVRQPQESIIAIGSKVQLQTLETPGGQIQYWRAVQMYATSYSPCRSGISKCSYGTASGAPVKRGIVAMIRDLYNQLSGSQVYIPGYGLAVIADVGGGFPDGRLWIDLGYSDEDFQTWSGPVTVYFLAPAPASIPAVLE